MSNALSIESLLSTLQTAISEAWPGVPLFLGQPRVSAPTPYAALTWARTTVSFDGLGAGISQMSQKNVFRIVGRFPFPADPSQQVEALKATQANALIAHLQPTSEFGVGILPLVTEIATDLKAAPEGIWEVALTFEVITLADHH
jgi:hypothetical protein